MTTTAEMNLNVIDAAEKKYRPRLGASPGEPGRQAWFLWDLTEWMRGGFGR
jgi:hypothetical protein